MKLNLLEHALESLTKDPAHLDPTAGLLFLSHFSSAPHVYMGQDKKQYTVDCLMFLPKMFSYFSFSLSFLPLFPLPLPLSPPLSHNVIITGLLQTHNPLPQPMTQLCLQMHVTPGIRSF